MTRASKPRKPRKQASKKQPKLSKEPKPRREPKPPRGEFGPALRALREEKGVKLRELSDQLVVSLPYLSDVERGERDPLSNSRIIRVALYLKVDPMPLLAIATKERGRVVLEVPQADSLRVQTAMMLSLWWPDASDETLVKFQEMLKSIQELKTAS